MNGTVFYACIKFALIFKQRTVLCSLVYSTSDSLRFASKPLEACARRQREREGRYLITTCVWLTSPEARMTRSDAGLLKGILIYRGPHIPGL